MNWVKKISALFLLLAFSLQYFNKAFIVVNYYTNTQQYAQNCINKSRPKLHCNGQCQMMKRLKAQENKDANNPDRKGENKSETFSPFILINDNFLAYNLSVKTAYPFYNDNSVRAISRSCFHPPGIV